MRLVKIDGTVIDEVRETPLTVSEIQGFVGGHFEILTNRHKIDGVWHLVCLHEDAHLDPVQNMKASKMVGRVVYGDVLFLLDGKEIN